MWRQGRAGTIVQLYAVSGLYVIEQCRERQRAGDDRGKTVAGRIARGRQAVNLGSMGNLWWKR